MVDKIFLIDNNGILISSVHYSNFSTATLKIGMLSTHNAGLDTLLDWKEEDTSLLIFNHMHKILAKVASP